MLAPDGLMRIMIRVYTSPADDRTSVYIIDYKAKHRKTE